MKRLIKVFHTFLLAFVFSFLLYLYVQEGPQAVLNISIPSIIITLLLFLLSFVEIASPARRTYQVTATPGAIIMKMARFFYSDKTVEEVFEPTQRDFLDEFAEAISDHLLAEGLILRGSTSLWVLKVRCKYYFAFFRAVATQNYLTVAVRKVYRFIIGS